jgi:hypothetical protein
MKSIFVLLAIVLSISAFSQCAKSKQVIGAGVISTGVYPMGVYAEYASVPQEALFGMSIGLFGTAYPSEAGKTKRSGFNMGVHGSVLIKMARIRESAMFAGVVGGNVDASGGGVFTGIQTIVYLGDNLALTLVSAYDVIKKGPLIKFGFYL